LFGEGGREGGRERERERELVTMVLETVTVVSTLLRLLPCNYDKIFILSSTCHTEI